MQDSEFAAAIEGVRSKAMKYAMRLCHNDRDRAQDVMQDASVRAWEHRSSFQREADRFDSWFCTILFRLFIDRYRQRQRASLPLFHANAMVSSQNVEADYERQETMRLAVSVLRMLDNASYDILVRDWDTNETALAMGIPPATLKSRIKRSRAIVRERLLCE